MNAAARQLVRLELPTRTATAAAVSLVVARLFRLPETYWAAISTLVVMQSTLGAALPISAQRFAGTALGAAAGALGVLCFGGRTAVFAAVVFALGLLCLILRLSRNAYRFAGVTAAIVVLVARPENPWVIAIHRFIEVAIGIAVGLAMSALWPEHSPKAD